MRRLYGSEECRFRRICWRRWVERWEVNYYWVCEWRRREAMAEEEEEDE